MTISLSDDTMCRCGHKRLDHTARDGACMIEYPFRGQCECLEFQPKVKEETTNIYPINKNMVFAFSNVPAEVPTSVDLELLKADLEEAGFEADIGNGGGEDDPCLYMIGDTELSVTKEGEVRLHGYSVPWDELDVIRRHLVPVPDEYANDRVKLLKRIVLAITTCQPEGGIENAVDFTLRAFNQPPLTYAESQTIYSPEFRSEKK